MDWIRSLLHRVRGNHDDPQISSPVRKSTPDEIYESLDWSHITRPKEMDHTQPISEDKLRIVCISDTHNKTDDLYVPPGDVLIHSGDFTNSGEVAEIKKFNEFLGRLDFKHKLVICGNHEFTFGHYDGWLEPISLKPAFLKEIVQQVEEAGVNHPKELLTNCTYLNETSVVIAGMKIYGSPCSAYINGWAYNLRRGEAAMEHYSKVPDDTDVLITHQPPLGIGDSENNWIGNHIGCAELLTTVTQRVKPKLHAFGHIHSSHGLYYDGVTLYANAAICPNYHPISIDLDIPEGCSKDDIQIDGS